MILKVLDARCSALCNTVFDRPRAHMSECKPKGTWFTKDAVDSFRALASGSIAVAGAMRARRQDGDKPAIDLLESLAGAALLHLDDVAHEATHATVTA